MRPLSFQPASASGLCLDFLIWSGTDLHTIIHTHSASKRSTKTEILRHSLSFHCVSAAPAGGRPDLVLSDIYFSRSSEMMSDEVNFDHHQGVRVRVLESVVSPSGRFEQSVSAPACFSVCAPHENVCRCICL